MEGRALNQETFSLLLIIGGALFIVLALWMRSRSIHQSGFRAYGQKSESKKASPHLQLGMPFPESGQPHEILGVRPDASPREIQKAFRDLMKRYHPDRLAKNLTAKEAGRITALIIQAKEDLLKKNLRN